MLPSPPSSPAMRHGHRSMLRRCERACCGVITYFPLLLVFGLSTWGIWVEVHMGLLPETSLGSLYIVIGVALYVLLNWSYFTAVFTDPGSPMTSEPHDSDAFYNTVTVKSDGGMRFCKKCQAKKPDRAHHCSSCRRCVLKMDHHCPWLATCVGFRNYKPFLLFLVYSSLLNWLCFWISAAWLYHEVIVDRRIDDTTMPVHFVILSVVSGIVGLVLSAFTVYHVYLTCKNRTTIESLEKTRYLSPLRSQVDQRLHEPRTYVGGLHNGGFGEQLRHFGTALTEMHVNALPGVLRSEEGEGDDAAGPAASPAQASLRRAAGSAAVHVPSSAPAGSTPYAPYDTYDPPSPSFHHRAAAPMRDEERQYDAYLDERDSALLPHAFDLGWRANLLAVLGRSPWLWGLPVCNSPGDGWAWERSAEWARRRDVLRRVRVRETEARAAAAAAAPGGQPMGLARFTPDAVVAPWEAPGEPLAPRRAPVDSSDDDDDDDDDGGRRRLLAPREAPQRPPRPSDPHPGTRVVAGWNDVPADMLGRGGLPPPRRTPGQKTAVR